MVTPIKIYIVIQTTQHGSVNDSVHIDKEKAINRAKEMTCGNPEFEVSDLFCIGKCIFALVYNQNKEFGYYTYLWVQEWEI